MASNLPKPQLILHWQLCDTVQSISLALVEIVLGWKMRFLKSLLSFSSEVLVNEWMITRQVRSIDAEQIRIRLTQRAKRNTVNSCNVTQSSAQERDNTSRCVLTSLSVVVWRKT